MAATQTSETESKVTEAIDNIPSVEHDSESSKTAAIGDIEKNGSDENSKDNPLPLYYKYIYLDSHMDSYSEADKINNMESETDAVDQLIDPKSGYIAHQNEIPEDTEISRGSQLKDSCDTVDSQDTVDDNNNGIKAVEENFKPITTESGWEMNNIDSGSSVTDKNTCRAIENGEKLDPLNAEIHYIFDKSDLSENAGKYDDAVKAKSHEIDSSSGDLIRGRKDKQMESETLENQQRNVDKSENFENAPETASITLDDVTAQSDQLSNDDVSLKSTDKNLESKDNDANQSNLRIVEDANETARSANEHIINNYNSSGLNRKSLSLNLPCQSPEDDGRGVSPEIVCLTHLSPTTLYGKEPTFPRLLSKQDNLSRPPSLNTPDPVVYGESDSSSCPTPFMYTSSNCMPNYGHSSYTSNDNQFMETNYAYVMPEDPLIEHTNFLRGQKRKISETDINNNNIETNSNLSDIDRVTPDLFPFSTKHPAVMGQMYHSQGRPPDVSTWTAVNSGACKYKTGFGGSCGQNYGNSFTRDPFLFGYQQQYSDCGYNSQMNGQFSSKPTCMVPPYMLNHTQTTDSYSAYSQTIDGSQQFGSEFNFPVIGNTHPNTIFDPSEQTRASCQYASNHHIDVNNNQFSNASTFTSRACYRLDFSSPVNQEQYQYSFPVPTFVSTHSYLSGLSKPEPVFPNSNPLITAHRRTATCTSTYSRPSSAMSTRSDNSTEAPSINLTQPTSDEETVIEGDKEENIDTNNNTIKSRGIEVSHSQINNTEVQKMQNERENDLTETENNEIPPDTRNAKVSENKIENMIVPLRARSTQFMCSVKDLAAKTVKELIQTAENKSESDGEHYASSSTQSASSPPPAHQNQKVTESFAAEFVRQRKTKSPISAFCAALDLSKPKKKETCRPILPQPNVQPAIPIPSLLNVNGPTLAYSGSMMVPYLQTLCAANSYLNTSKTMPDNYSAQKYIPIVPNRMPYTSTVSGSYTSTSQTSNIPNPSALMNFAPYATLPVQNLQYLPYIGAAASVPVNQLPTSGNANPNINLSNIPLPLYQHLPQSLEEQGETTQTGTLENNNTKEQMQQFLCRRNLGMAAPVTTESSRRVNRMETRGRKKKSSASSIALPPTTIPGYTATIQGCTMTTEPSKDAVTYHPTPARLHEATIGTGGKRPFKARHCNFSILRIGTFQYTCPTISYEKIARVKFLYSKKKLLYEFQLNNLEDTITPHRRLTEIEVPFNTVVGLWMFEREMRLEVNTPPTMCLGSKVLEKNTKHGVHAAPIYDRQVLVDLTDGQLRTVPYHYIQFKSCCAEKLKTEMGLFDSRFSLLLRSPLIEDPNKTLKIPEVPITSHLLEAVQHAAKSRKGRLKSYSGCRCETGCSSDLCPCCVRGGTCTEGECLCINCRNPLNILHQLGLPVHRARTDPCLMENIYQIKKLECYVKIQLVLECCQIPLTLLQCVPGTFTCPSIGCGTKYTYSWCCAQLCNEDVAPRNHCVKCGRCTDYRNKHCELCNICYFAGESGSFKCPVCHNSLEEEDYELDSSSESDGYGQ